MKTVSRADWRDYLQRWACHTDGPGTDAYWCPEWDCATPGALDRLQSEKLALAVAYLYHHSPFYRQLYDAAGIDPTTIRGKADLPRLPIVTKEMMSRDVEQHPPWGTYTAVTDEEWNRSGWMLFTTSGTTARPRPFRYTKLDCEMWTWTDARALWAMGIRPGDRALLAFGYGPHVAMWGMHYALNRMGVPILPSASWNTGARVDAILTYHPTILAATPSYALNLAEVVRARGVDPAATAVRLIILLGEPAPDSTQHRIAQAWGAELHQFWGCTEAAPSCGGYTCRYGVHVMEDTHLIEVVDPHTLQPVPEGQEGLAVVTNLCSEASPQIRFLVGDYTRLVRDNCSCGRTHVRTPGFQGRADDMLNIRGVTVFPSAVEEIVRSFPELGNEFQIVLDKEGGRERFSIQVELLPDHANRSDVADAIKQQMRSHFDLSVDVEILPWGTLPKTEFKARRVKDLRRPG